MMGKIISTPVIIGLILILPFLGCAQSGDELALAQNLSEGFNVDLVVDLNSSTGPYPSMEEEMSIYLKLMDETPQAFFFPNPSNGVLWIEHNLGSEITLYLKDMHGNAIYTAHDISATKLDLSGFKQGKYILTLKGKNGAVTKNVIVK